MNYLFSKSGKQSSTSKGEPLAVYDRSSDETQTLTENPLSLEERRRFSNKEIEQFNNMLYEGIFTVISKNDNKNDLKEAAREYALEHNYSIYDGSEERIYYVKDSDVKYVDVASNGMMKYRNNNRKNLTVRTASDDRILVGKVVVGGSKKKKRSTRKCHTKKAKSRSKRRRHK
jgi:hypothetical protein